MTNETCKNVARLLVKRYCSEGFPVRDWVQVSGEDGLISEDEAAEILIPMLHALYQNALFYGRTTASVEQLADQYAPYPIQVLRRLARILGDDLVSEDHIYLTSAFGRKVLGRFCARIVRHIFRECLLFVDKEIDRLILSNRAILSRDDWRLDGPYTKEMKPKATDDLIEQVVDASVWNCLSKDERTKRHNSYIRKEEDIYPHDESGEPLMPTVPVLLSEPFELTIREKGNFTDLFLSTILDEDEPLFEDEPSEGFRERLLIYGRACCLRDLAEFFQVAYPAIRAAREFIERPNAQNREILAKSLGYTYVESDSRREK
jgi:hypothetical protein